MFVGREEQFKQLKDLWRKPVGSLVTCRGRRRIGKSTLIAEFARRNRVSFIKLEGLPPREGVTNDDQLQAFARQLSDQTGTKYEPLTCWFDAFARLDASIDQKSKTVVLLDEISWMGMFDVNFPGELKYAWDNRFSKKNRLIVVLCGSVSSWIDKNILKSKGFVGRPSLNLIIPELSMQESYAFWTQQCKGCNISTHDIVDVLSVTGGVPKYLESIDPSVGADENIAKLCFRAGSLLLDEFNEIFDDALDQNLSFKKKLLLSLALGAKTHSELAEALGVDTSGFITDNLEALEAAGFIARDEGLNPTSGKRTKQAEYRICDNYTRFYLKYIEPSRSLIKRNAYRFMSAEQLPGWNSMLGLQFEALVYNNMGELLRLLDLDRTLLLSASPFQQRKTARKEGCQIDLLLQTKHSIYVVEIKRRENIGEEVISAVKEKIRRLKVTRGVNVIPVLVYDGKLSKRVAADGYFSRIISADQLLGKETR